MALTDSQNTRSAAHLLANVAAQAARRVRGWISDSSDRTVAQRVAGTAFLIRVFSAGLIYLSQIVLARWMGGHEFGIYVYVWTWVLMIGDMADLGLATAAQRFIPQYGGTGSFDLLRGFLWCSRWFAAASATAIGTLGIGLVWLLGPYLDREIVLPLSIACVALPFYSVMQMQDGIARSYNWIRLALLPPYVVRHLVMLTLVALAFLFRFPTNAETVVTIVAIAFALTMVGQTVILNRKLRRVVAPGAKATAAATWFSVSLPILMVEGFYLLLTNTDILVLQQFRGVDNVAVYYAAAKTLALIAFVHFAVSAAVGHRFSEYHITADRERLRRILSDSIRWTFWASLLACIVILALGRPLLALFGSQFIGGYHLMFILAVGLMARGACGPVERLLNMLGEQRLCAAVYAAAFGLNLVLCLLLIPRMGVEGAATATAAALIAESLLLFIVTKRRLGFHVFIWGRS